jgi:hypothetical protein
MVWFNCITAFRSNLDEAASLAMGEAPVPWSLGGALI